MKQQGDTTALLCHRCGAILEPGDGSFYVVSIEAMADPTPPTFDLDEEVDFAAEVRKIVEAAKDRSEREMMDDVYRRLTIHLCRPCYTEWIDRIV